MKLRFFTLTQLYFHFFVGNSQVVAKEIDADIAPGANQLGGFSGIFGEVNKELVKNSAISSNTNFVSNLFTVVLPYVFIIAGLGLFLMLLSGGFQIMTAVQNPEGADAGKKRITAAFIGFFILFASYWIVQALEIIFGITILG
jgi:hypothetical protein